MDREQIIEVGRRFIELVRNHIVVKKAVLFGSQVKGTARADSDIDIAIIVDRIDGDYLTIEAELFKLRRNIDYRIEPILLEEDNDPSGFMQEILKTGEILYDT